MANLYGFGGQYQGEKQAFDTWKNQFEAIKSAMDVGIIQQEEYYQRLADIDEQYLANKQAIMVGSYQQIFGSLGSVMRAFGGENSKIYTVMLNIEKGYALQKAILNSKVAISDAWANTAGGYFAKAVAVGKVIIQNQEIISAISAFTPKGFKTGGYTGNVGTSQVAGVVHGQEYVLNAQATKRLGVDTLNRLNRGGGIAPNIIINNYSGEKAEVGQQPNGDLLVVIGQVVDAKIAKNNIMQMRQGGLLYGR